MLESTVEAALVREAKRRGVLAVKLNIVGRRGWPDRLLVSSTGRLAVIELKRPGGKPRPLQQIIHRRLRRRLVDVFTVDRKEDIGPVLDGWLAGGCDRCGR